MTVSVPADGGLFEGNSSKRSASQPKSRTEYATIRAPMADWMVHALFEIEQMLDSLNGQGTSTD